MGYLIYNNGHQLDRLIFKEIIMTRVLQKLHIRTVFLPLFIAICLCSCWPSESKKSVAKFPKVVFYEIFVQSFADSNNDSIGDLEGIKQKLDYLTELGIKGLWLMPISPSPSYHKYDVTDYMGIDPKYGDKAQFKDLVNECHKRDIKVVIDLVLNHTSAQHPWFLDAKKSEQSKYHDYYVWSSDSSTIAKDRAHWYSPKDEMGKDIAGPKFYGYFSKNMPDLNYDNPKVKQEVFKIVKFWMTDMDIDGFRLDAARHIFPEDRMKENYAWWNEFSKEVRKIKPNAYIVGEVWDTEDAVAPFLNKSLQSTFNFGLSSSILKAVNTGNDSCIASRLENFHRSISVKDSTALDAIFLGNHDKERIMTTLGNETPKAKIAASLLLTLQGIPFIYYGEEIGMIGAKPDKYIREPMIWDADNEDQSRTKWIKALFSTTRSVEPVKAQALDKKSLLNHYKRMITIRNAHPALSMGDMQARKSESEHIISFYRNYKNEKILVMCNISDTSQTITLEGKDTSYSNVLISSEPHSLAKVPVLILAPYSCIVLSTQ